MLIAQKKYEYAELERQTIHAQNYSAPAAGQKRKTSIKPVQKVKIIMSIFLLCSICIGVLLGYTQLAEMKYKINLLQKEIKELEVSIENLKVDVESVQRLDIIEQKAQVELGMQYPQKEQMVFLNINPFEVGISYTQENIDPVVQKSLFDDVKQTIHKFIRN